MLETGWFAPERGGVVLSDGKERMDGRSPEVSLVLVPAFHDPAA